MDLWKRNGWANWRTLPYITTKLICILQNKNALYRRQPEPLRLIKRKVCHNDLFSYKQELNFKATWITCANILLPWFHCKSPFYVHLINNVCKTSVRIAKYYLKSHSSLTVSRCVLWCLARSLELLNALWQPWCWQR